MLWQLYFWLFALLMIGTTIGRAVLYFVKPGSVSIYEIVESLPGLACVVAVYGFAYGVLLGSKPIWLAVACALPILYITSMLSGKARIAYRKLGTSKAILVFGTTFLLTLPAYVALVLYAAQFA